MLFYPSYQRWYYKRHYNKFVEEARKGCFNIQCRIEISDDFIATKDSESEVKLSTSEITTITEISDYYFLKFKSGSSLLLPKREFDQQALQGQLKKLAHKNNTEINIELNWRWK